ncbi:acyl-CoA dehydrogenase family protein [Brevibacillus ruminantium]|uniref:Acyl-CoA dehydrogenase family protein n=1 Tax=Brevibacillus ruminantium TaxID=2950604 RepID=A0ABY4WJV0_9BACL|nr:acyl-CoA dehydrogenase family protein [Brevibacillus ruminantium]USG67416.1 acyl-CoA dehydrogenase family protein [Brevibacillus ruminantium]
MKVLQDISVTEKRNFFAGDDTLQIIVRDLLNGPLSHYATRQLDAFGELCANEIDERAKHSDREGQPVLKRYDRFGEERSDVWVNEGYRKTIQQTYDTGIVGYVHKKIPELGQKGNYTYSFAQGYLLSQAEPGIYCPVTLTMATAYLLDHYADNSLKKKLLPHVCSTGELQLYEGATFLTERQGGSDVGANVVRAVENGGTYRLYGEKYFASNAGKCGVAMVLARIEGAPTGFRGLTLFAVPWRGEDGSLNGIRIRRLKDKLGVRAVPSGEVEFDGAEAYIVGDPAKGFYYMMEALNLSRICNAIASVGIMRRALVESKEYASRRNAFGKCLTDFPMVKDTLGKLAAKLHVEVATMFDLIQLYEKVTDGTASEREVILHRVFIAIMKKETAEQAIHFAHEAIEMHGGNGYIEDFVTPRLLRDAQVLTVWEGTANILGLELVRLVQKYAAHTLFVDEMKGRLAALADSPGKAVVASELERLADLLDQFAGYEEALQTFEAKGLAQRMAWVYESVVAIEWASRYGGKFEKLADIYLDETWGLRQPGGRMKTVEFFEEIV